MAMLGQMSSAHAEQCSVAEHSAFVARDVLAHIDLAAEARVKPPAKKLAAVSDDDEASDDDGEGRPNFFGSAADFEDIGGGAIDCEEHQETAVFSRVKNHLEVRQKCEKLSPRTKIRTRCSWTHFH